MTERPARRRKPSKSVEQLKAEIDARDNAKAEREEARKTAKKKTLSPGEQYEIEKQRMRERLKKGVSYMYTGVSKEEYIIDYLLDEGFASDEKSASAIVGAMSEEWKQSIVEAPGEWFGGIRDKSRASRAAQMQSLQQPPKPLPSVASPFAKPASKTDSGKLTTYGAGGGAAAENSGQTRAQVMQQGAKNLENKKRTQPVNQGPDFGR